MSAPSSAMTVRSPAAPYTGRLSSTAAFYLQASITVSFLAGSSAPTPIYPIYQQQWGFSPIAITLVFGIYALAVLSALLVFGRLSDHIGRRPVLIAATAAQAITMLLFATADGLAGLMTARVLQGISTGAAVAAVGAGLLDLNKERGASANAIAPTLGTALGGLLAGFAVQFLPAPTHLVYLFLCVVFILQGLGVLAMPESLSPRAGALRSLKPQLRLPAATRGPFLFALPALVATWALPGFYGSLAPMLIHALSGLNSPLLGGLALFVLAGSGAAAILLTHRHSPRAMMTRGTASLFIGVAMTLAALPYHSSVLFFVGTAIAGFGFGASFQGAVRAVVLNAAPHDRAGVLSVVFVVSYLAMGLPAILAGYHLAHGGSLFATATEFGAFVMGLAALALLGAHVKVNDASSVRGTAKVSMKSC